MDDNTLLDILVDMTLTPQEAIDKLETYRGISAYHDEAINNYQSVLRDEMNGGIVLPWEAR